MKLFAYSRKQELANSLTHGLGILLSLAGVPVLFWIASRQALTDLHWAALVVYGLSLLMVYINSTLYHALWHQTAKRIFKILDHISIYFLIAGTTTFFVLYYTEGTVTSIFLISQWVLVLAGTFFKLFYTGRFKLLSTLLYLGLGLMVLFIIHTLWLSMPAVVFGWILAGGLFYIAGVVFYLWKRLYYQHAIWHLFVLGGSISHYVALLHSLQTTS